MVKPDYCSNIPITLTDGALSAKTSSGTGCAELQSPPQNNGLPMLSFRDAAIPNAGRNHYSIRKQVLPSYGMPTLP